MQTDTSAGEYITAAPFIRAVEIAVAPEPVNPTVAARIDIAWRTGETEIVWVNAGGDMLGLGGTVQARMARMIQDTWRRVHAEGGKNGRNYPNYLYVIDHGSVTLSDMSPRHDKLPDRLKSAKAVLPAYLPEKAAAAFLCLVS